MLYRAGDNYDTPINISLFISDYLRAICTFHIYYKRKVQLLRVHSIDRATINDEVIILYDIGLDLFITNNNIVTNTHTHTQQL